MVEQAERSKGRRRFRRDSIIFAVGVGGMAVELAAAIVGRGPHPWLVGAFLACMFAPAGLRYGDRTLDALKWLRDVDDKSGKG